MRRLILLRLSDDGNRTLGLLLVMDNVTKIFEFATIELPWRNNERQVSCIPAGTYQLTPTKHKKFGDCFLVEGVKGRDGIMLHAANFVSNVRGCVGVGMAHRDIDGDGRLDAAASRQAMSLLVNLIKGSSLITIYDAPKV